MLGHKVELFLFFLYFCLELRGLESVSLTDDDVILFTESAIRNITNNLFIKLNLKNIKQNSKLKQSSLVHNFFTSVTLKDHKALNKIVKLSRVDKNSVNNETEGFVNLINEILNDGTNDADDAIAPNEDIIQYVDEFLTNIEGFKENSGIKDGYESLEIKDELLKILFSNDNVKLNVSQNNEIIVNNETSELLSDNEFWVPEPETRRIYRGDRTKIKYFPFMASIQIFNTFQCAGSIIKSDLVITAASCLQLAWNNRFFRENPSFLSVRVGSNFYNGGGENIPVLEVYFHPTYNPKNLRHNLAICRLLRHLKFRKYKRRLKKIEIDTNRSPLPSTTDGVTIVGWGARGHSNIILDPWSNQLAYAVLDIYHLQECQEIYSREYVTLANFCAGFVSKGGGACNRDVGGPGIVSGKLAGVVSFGSPVCGTPDAPTVFTKVGFYADWIEEIMDQDVPHMHRQTTLLPDPLPVTYPQVAPWKDTSFKIAPVIGPPSDKPVPIQSIDGPDTLRIIKDEGLFKDFLSTMFNSKESNQYKDMLIDNTVKKSKRVQVIPAKQQSKEHSYYMKLRKQKPKTKQIEELIGVYDEDTNAIELSATELLASGTKMNNFESETLRPDQKITVMDENIFPNDSEAIEKNIAKIIDNIEMANTDEDDVSSGKESEVKSETNFKQVTVNTLKKYPLKIAEKILKKKDDPNVLTLLYISDNEKSSINSSNLDTIGNIIADFDDNFDNEGLALPMDTFRDATFRNNQSSVLNFMSRDELYDLLSEAIDEIANNKV